MNINELPSNSHKSKQETTNDRKFESVVTGNIRKRKKTELTKFANSFVSEDLHTVRDHIFYDVIIPELKNLIDKVLKGGIDALLWGSSSGSKNNGTTKASYREYYSKSRVSGYSYSSEKSNNYDFEDIVFDNRRDAEVVLDTMYDALERYRIVTVNDYYDMSGARIGGYTDVNYGWKDLSSARVERVKNGFIVRLPKASPID